jgi:hypothetical protein
VFQSLIGAVLTQRSAAFTCSIFTQFVDDEVQPWDTPKIPCKGLAKVMQSQA